MPTNPKIPGPSPFAESEGHDSKVGIKMPPGPKSMFDGKPRVQTSQEFQKKIQVSEDKKSVYKQRAADLFVQFNKSISDKTLPQNRNVLNRDAEREMLQEMVQLAIEINNDPNEQEGMGSLTWITCLFKTVMFQRDRINELEFQLTNFNKKIEGPGLADYINKEIIKVLDKKKSNE